MSPGRETIGIGMVGHAFMGAVHSHAWRSVHRFFDPPLVPRLGPAARLGLVDRVVAARDLDVFVGSAGVEDEQVRTLAVDQGDDVGHLRLSPFQ